MMKNNTIAVNKKAKYDYFLSDRFEAGIALHGYEVKSIREGRVNIKDSFVRIIKDELYLFNCHISRYSHLQGWAEVNESRDRKLLLHKYEIEKIKGFLSRKGKTCVPTFMYFKKGRVKVEIAIAEGKKMVDKRETIKRRIHDREAQAAMKKYSKR